MKKIMGLLLIMGLMVSFGGCGKDSPTGASEEITEGPQGQTLEVSEQEIKIYTDKQGREVPKEEYDKMLSFVRGEIKVFKNVEYQFYRNGNEEVKHGYYKEYDENGQIIAEGEYKKDGETGREWSGKFIEYYYNGQIRYEENYKDGKEEGRFVSYYENGEIVDEDIWKDGECIEMCEGDE